MKTVIIFESIRKQILRDHVIFPLTREGLRDILLIVQMYLTGKGQTLQQKKVMHDGRIHLTKYRCLYLS